MWRKCVGRIVKWDVFEVISGTKQFFLTVSLALPSCSCTAMWKRRSSPSRGWWLPSPPSPGSSPTTRSSSSLKDKRDDNWPCLQEMNQWWVDDLPLPLPHTTYRWARDQDMLVRNPTRDEEGWKLNRIHTGPAEHACSNGPQLLLHSRLCTRLHQAGPQHLLPGLQVLHIIFICYNFSRDLVARPEEAWASLASYCGLDPTNAKPLEAHKKLVSVDVFNNF